MKERFKSVCIFVVCFCIFFAIGIGIIYKVYDNKESTESVETTMSTEKSMVQITTTTEPSTTTEIATTEDVKESTETEVIYTEESTFENKVETTNIETTKTTKTETTKEHSETTTEKPKTETTTKESPKETKEETETTTEKRVEDSGLVSLGEFRLTAYCNCSKCCGQWAGSPTASGVMPRANHTIAVDTSVIPFGTKVVINGNTYVAEDTGSAIKGNRIDIFFDSHSSALNFGVQYAEVFVVK